MNENIYYMEDIRITLKEIKPVVGEVGINKIKVLLEEKLKYSRFTYSFTYKGELEKITIGQWDDLYRCCTGTYH